jgi:hypothetical protein
MVKKAVLIGINYRGTSLALQGCINDVRNVYNFLTSQAGYSPENIRVLTDDDIQPTNSNIKSNISWLLDGAISGDTLMFHYSGHGSNIADVNGDETDKRDETIVPIDYSRAGMITDDWLFENFMSKVPQGVKLWAFMDCCHSGTVLDLKYNYRSLCNPKPGKPLSGPYVSSNWTNVFQYSTQRSRDIPGNVCMFSGSLDPQFAADAFINGKAQGAFTACLLDCLQNNLAQFRSLKLHDILKEVNVRLQTGGYNQRTQLSTSQRDNLKVLFDL